LSRTGAHAGVDRLAVKLDAWRRTGDGQKTTFAEPAAAETQQRR
jgi:hypothetical protein